jgi:hypothetical protein
MSVAEGLVLVRATFGLGKVDSVLWLQEVPISVAVRVRAWVCSLSLVGTVGSNSAGGMDDSFF